MPSVWPIRFSQRCCRLRVMQRVAPFGIGWLIACMQLPIHVSPFSASFVGHEPLGIHRTLFKAWPLRFVPSPLAVRDAYPPELSCDALVNHSARFGKIEANSHDDHVPARRIGPHARSIIAPNSSFYIDMRLFMCFPSFPRALSGGGHTPRGVPLHDRRLGFA